MRQTHNVNSIRGQNNFKINSNLKENLVKNSINLENITKNETSSINRSKPQSINKK